MNDKNQLIEKDQQNTELAETQNGAITPMVMLQMAVQKGADLDQMEKLMGLQERWEANEAKKAYVRAMNAFKANPPEIFKDSTVSYENSDGSTTTYKHASLAALRIAFPAYSPHRSWGCGFRRQDTTGERPYLPHV